MLNTWKRCLLLFIIMIFLPFTAQAYPSTMPIDQIQKGMRGIAKTVVSGTTIEDFNVEVLGIMAQPGASGNLILVKTSGDVIERTGGIVQGMSGSPVYIDGKLVGAIAYGWPLTDHTIGMVTPIADMLKLWDISDTKPSMETKLQNNSTLQPKPMVTPLMVSGFGESALSMLKEKLSPFQLMPYAVGNVPQSEVAPNAAFEPGSAAGIELVRGDVSIGAIGTVTYTEGNKVLAFGHPFLQKGGVSYFMTNASIFTVVNGLESGFKVGTTGDLVGMVTQDRKAGIAGVIGQYPSVIPIRITVNDVNTNKIQDDAVQVVQNEELAPILSATTAYNVIEKAMDRVGAGTANVSFTITARNMPGQTLQRENMFYSPANIGETAVGEFFEALNLLMNNQFNPVDIMDVKVKVEVDKERKTASIVSAKAQATTAKPGDTVAINVQLKPFRGEPITRTVNFTVPQEQAPGPLLLEVRGGGMVPLTQLLLSQQGVDEALLKGIKAKTKTKSFEDTLNNFVSRDRNNTVVVEILDTQMPAGAGGEEKTAENKAVDTEVLPQSQDDDTSLKVKKKRELTIENKGEVATAQAKYKAFITTDYIVDNDTQVLLNVEAKDTKK
ncbi:putative secreted protein [Propionispora sp. 2/2-37]|nr:putative secreted protein [Propionispora sp. 2/2-37]